MWEKKKLLVTTNFFFFHNVFPNIISQSRKNSLPKLSYKRLFLHPQQNLNKSSCDSSSEKELCLNFLKKLLKINKQTNKVIK